MTMIVVTGPASVQNSIEWFAWRSQGIGASEAPIITGLSKFSTAYELFRMRLGIGPPAPANPFVEKLRARGRALEPVARAAYEKHTGKVVTPLIAQSASLPFIRASFDGFDPFDSIPLEIKCPGQIAHSIALSGSVPKEYYDQVQQQIFVAESTHGHYYSYDGSSGVLLEVARDQARIDEILQADTTFWNRLKSGVWGTNEWEAAATAWKAANLELKAVEAREAYARDLLVALVPKGQQREEGAGVSVLLSGRRGRVDYRRMLADLGVTLTEAQIDDYRSSKSTTVKVRDLEPTLSSPTAHTPTITATQQTAGPASAKKTQDPYSQLNISPIPGFEIAF